MHIKRKTIPKFWPIPKTGTKYLAVPVHEPNNSITLILAMRNILKIVKTKKELKKLINDKKIEVNKKIVSERNYPISLFDTISLPSAKKHYRAVLDNKRIALTPIEEKESSTRVYKLVGKKMLPNKKVQLKFNLGRNIISSEKMNVGDFALFDLVKNTMLEILPMKKGVPVVIIAGKHMGKTGSVKDLVKEGGKVIAKIDSKEYGELSTHVKNLFIIK